MDYEKAYKNLVAKVKNAHLYAQTDSTKNVLEDILSELAESEDERIRTCIVDVIKENDWTHIFGVKKEDCLAWLEKQKESKVVEFDHFREQKPAQTETEKQYARTLKALVSDFIRDRNPEDVPYYQGIYDWLDGRHIEQKPAEPNDICVRKMVDTYRSTEEYDEAGNRKGTPVNCMVRAYEQGIRDVLKVVKQKPEVKLVFPKFRVGDVIQHIPLEKWDRTKKIISVDKDGYRFDYSHLGDSVSGGFIGFSFEKEYELVEQKPAEKQDYFGLTDFERAIHRGFLCAGVENVPVGIIKETAKDCITQMKPTEWSEEDETCLEYALWCVTKTRHFVAKDACDLDACRCAENWLKSLRPSWKPSEVQPKVDLEQEYQEFCKDYPFPWSSQYVNREYIDELCLSIARHFYELGFNARKEE